MVVRHTLGSGRGHGIVCAWAHSIGIGVYALITLLGLAVVLREAPVVFNGIAILGALYLAWLGIQSLSSKGGMQEKLVGGTRASTLTAARDGIAISLLNPKILLFFVSLFSQFVLAAETAIGNALIVLTSLIVDGLWYSLVAMLLSRKQLLPKLREKAGLIDKLSGVVLILLALRVLVTL